MAHFKGGEESSSFLKVEHVTARDNFTIIDEPKPYSGKFTKGEEASCTVKRKKDGATFTFVLKTFNLNKLVSAYGEDSREWIGKDITISREYTPKFNKNFLAVTPIIPDVQMEAPF